jgi:hypothetical protein
MFSRAVTTYVENATCTCWMHAVLRVYAYAYFLLVLLGMERTFALQTHDETCERVRAEFPTEVLYVF